MKSGGPLERKSTLQRGDKGLKRTELKRGKPLERTGPLRHRSKKMARLYRQERIPLVKEMLEERPWCELRLPGICWGRATTVHEVKTRARGGSIVDKGNCKASCVPCNDHVQDPRYAELVAERGLLKGSRED